MSFARSVFQRWATSGDSPAQPAGPGAPSVPWFFAAGMAAALAIAIFAGLLFGAFAATESGISHGRWTETVQAHGDLQLFGWVAVFLAILTFEFIVRINGRGAAFPVRPRLMVIAMFGVGAVLRALGQTWNDQLGFVWPIGAALIVLGSLLFAGMVLSVRPPNRIRLQPQPLWFWTASLSIVVAAVAGLAGSLRATGGVMDLAESRFVVELTVRGFVLNTIFAVAVRAFPGHLGLPMMQRGPHQTLWIMVNASLAAWLLGSGAFFLGDVEWLRQVGNFGLGVSLLLATWWLGMAGMLRNRVWRPYYRAMIPIAWVGVVAYAVALIGAAMFPGWGERDIFVTGGIRHIFMLGFMAPLMIGMSDVVLGRFGTGQILGERWLPWGFALVVISWPLRVVLPLFTSETNMLSHSVYGTAAILATAGLAIVGWICLKNALAIRQLVLARRRAHQQREHERRQMMTFVD